MANLGIGRFMILHLATDRPSGAIKKMFNFTSVVNYLETIQAYTRGHTQEQYKHVTLPTVAGEAKLMAEDHTEMRDSPSKLIQQVALSHR